MVLKNDKSFSFGPSLYRMYHYKASKRTPPTTTTKHPPCHKNPILAIDRANHTQHSFISLLLTWTSSGVVSLVVISERTACNRIADLHWIYKSNQSQRINSNYSPIMSSFTIPRAAKFAISALWAYACIVKIAPMVLMEAYKIRLNSINEYGKSILSSSS